MKFVPDKLCRCVREIRTKYGFVNYSLEIQTGITPSRLNALLNTNQLPSKDTFIKFLTTLPLTKLDKTELLAAYIIRYVEYQLKAREVEDVAHLGFLKLLKTL